MKAELRQKWIEALRSGKYLQGDGQLRKTDVDDEDNQIVRHCCLGVLADVAGLPVGDFAGHGFLAEDIVGTTARGPNVDACGLGTYANEGDPDYTSTDDATLTTVQRQLAALNDNGKSFAEIADWIEQHIPVES